MLGCIGPTDDAGVVDQDLDGSELFGDAIQQGIGALGIQRRQVAGQRSRPTARRLDSGHRVVGRPGVDRHRHIGTGARQADGNGLADAGGTAGHQRGHAVERER